MATMQNVAARAIMMVLCAVMGLTALTSCNEGGKNEVSSQGSSYSTITFEPNGEKDGGDVIFTISDGVESKSARIAVKSSVKADNDYEISPAQKAVAFTAAGDMTVDGTTASRKYNGSDAHQVSTSAHQDRLAVEVAGQTATVEFTGVTMTDVKVNDNTSLQPLDGQRERMSTPVNATWTLKATFDGKTKNFELKPSTAAIRWIPENAPEVVDSIIVWKDGEEIRSFYKVLATTEQAKIQVVYLLSDSSRVDGPAYSIEVPRQLWGSEDKMYVSKFEETIGTSFSGQSVVEPEAKSSEYSNENFTVSYETTKKTWGHTQLDVDGNKAKTALFGKLPHIVFNHGALSHDFGKLPLDVANTSVEVVEKSPVVEDGKSYEVKQLRNTIDTNYGVDSTGVVAQQVISTVDLLKLNVAVTLVDITAVMSRSWSATQGTFTWKLTEKYSNGSTKDTTIVWSAARSIEANHFDKVDVKKALTEGNVTTAVAHSENKTFNAPAYSISYKMATATYSWVNTFVKEAATSVVTSSLPENVVLKYKGYEFAQPADEISYTRESGSLIDSYDDGSKKIYDYKANFFESVKGYEGSAAKAIATGTLTVNAAVPTSWELISKVNEYILFNHTVGAKYRVTYSDGSTQEFEFNKTINGESSSTAVETTEDEVSERVGAPADYILRKENKQDGNISFAMWTTKVDENTERSRGEHKYGFTYSIGREVKYVKDFGNGVVVEINFEDPTISHDTEMTDFVQTGEEEVEGGTKETWKRNNNLLVNINGQNNTISNYGVINIFEAAPVSPDYNKVIVSSYETWARLVSNGTHYGQGVRTGLFVFSDNTCMPYAIVNGEVVLGAIEANNGYNAAAYNKAGQLVACLASEVSGYITWSRGSEAVDGASVLKLQGNDFNFRGNTWKNWKNVNPTQHSTQNGLTKVWFEGVNWSGTFAGWQ
jgi:hypothetical protein